MSSSKFLKKNLLLIGIIFLAIILRFAKLESIPIGFNDDEAAFGYNAYSILKTGRDEWARLLPFPVFESFGDWKLAGYLYLTVASQLLFGTSVFATRFPSAIFGVLAVFATYLLARKLFDKKVALLASFFLAITPWHIVASRNAFESDILIFFITISTYLFLTGLSNQNFLRLSFLGFAISFYIYRSSWLFVPLFVLTLIYSQKNQLPKIKTELVKNIIFTVIFLLPLVPTFLTFKGQSRFFQESFIAGVQRSGIIDEINQKLGTCQKTLPIFFCKVIYNKYSSYFSTYINNYFSNLSPETYYIRGNSGGYQSFSIRSHFYSFELPIFLIGLIFLVTKKHPAAKILISWILIVPLGASLTGVGNPGRLNILMPATQIIAAFGAASLFREIKSLTLRKLSLLFVTLVIFISIARLAVDMFYYYPKVSGKFQRYGYKHLFDYLESQKADFNQIAISRKTDDAKQYIHYLFFEKVDPNKFHDSQFSKSFRGQDKWQVVEQVGNFKFYPSTPGLEKLPPKSLLAVGEKEILFPTQPIFTVDYLNGDRAFEVYNVDKIKEKLKEIATGE